MNSTQRVFAVLAVTSASFTNTARADFIFIDPMHLRVRELEERVKQLERRLAPDASLSDPRQFSLTPPAPSSPRDYVSFAFPAAFWPTSTVRWTPVEFHSSVEDVSPFLLQREWGMDLIDDRPRGPKK